MTAEEKYRQQMGELGIWQDIFGPEVHTLCMMERELRRAQTRHKQLQEMDDGKAADACYALILQLRRDILSHRDALGLTPKSLQRLKSREEIGTGGDEGGGVIVLAEVVDDGEEGGGMP